MLKKIENKQDKALKTFTRAVNELESIKEEALNHIYSIEVRIKDLELEKMETLKFVEKNKAMTNQLTGLCSVEK